MPVQQGKFKMRVGGIYLLGNGQIRRCPRMYSDGYYELVQIDGHANGAYGENGWLVGERSASHMRDGYYVVKEIRP